MTSCRHSRLSSFRIPSLALFPLFAWVLCFPLRALAQDPLKVKVIGYVPAFMDMRSIIDRTDLNKLTHLNIAFLNPDSEGDFASSGEPLCMHGSGSADIRYVVSKAHERGVKVLAALGGGLIPSCAGSWEELLKPENRSDLLEKLLAFVSDFGLDGIDVDLEGVLLTNIDNAGNYTPFVKELREGLPDGKLLTAATASYVGGMVPISSLPYFDFVNIMSYDTIGPSWGTAGSEHSSFDSAVTQLAIWKARGLQKEKMILGVPFYGYGFGKYQATYSFNDIVNQFGGSAFEKDLIGDLCAGCDYITYNGLSTIRRKTRLALDETSGLMIWELSQDAFGNRSLLTAIHDEINAFPKKAF